MMMKRVDIFLLISVLNFRFSTEQQSMNAVDAFRKHSSFLSSTSFENVTSSVSSEVECAFSTFEAGHFAFSFDENRCTAIHRNESASCIGDVFLQHFYILDNSDEC